MNKQLLAMIFALSCVGVSAQESDVADVQVESEVVDVSKENCDAGNSCGDVCEGALSQVEDVAEAEIDVEPKVVELA